MLVAMVGVLSHYISKFDITKTYCFEGMRDGFVSNFHLRFGGWPVSASAFLELRSSPEFDFSI